MGFCIFEEVAILFHYGKGITVWLQIRYGGIYVAEFNVVPGGT